MIHSHNYHRLLALLLSLGLALLAGACGEEKSSTGSTVEGPGQAMVLIHDAPIDSLKELWLTISSVRLIGADADSAEESILAEPLRIDFLSLDSISRVLTVAEVEGQTFSKIRLEVSDPEFLDVHDNLFDASQIQLVANGKVDLNFQGPVSIPPEGLSVISVDLDVANAIQINQTGNDKYILHPQFKIDATVETGTSVEMPGCTIVSIDATPPGATLVVECPGSVDPVTVIVDESTEIKDESGDPILLGDLTPGMNIDIEGSLDTESGVIVATEIRIAS